VIFFIVQLTTDQRSLKTRVGDFTRLMQRWSLKNFFLCSGGVQDEFNF